MICIGHEDGKTKMSFSFHTETSRCRFDFKGNVIIGSVEGSRVAGKNLRNDKLAKVEVRRIDVRVVVLFFIFNRVDLVVTR